MSSAATTVIPRRNDYPTSDGRPMAETDWHYRELKESRDTLDVFYVEEPLIYVSGNLLIFYQRGNKRKHVAPDVFVVKGVAKYERPNFLTWEEGKTPDWIMELTSSSTRWEDMEKKFLLYQNVFKTKEYFLFDPLGDYLEPALKGYRLRRGKYAPIRPVKGRLPSQVLGLHVEAAGKSVRFYDPAAERWLPRPAERAVEAEAARRQENWNRLRAEAAQQRAETAARQAEAAQRQAEAAQQTTEAENERLRRELAELRRRTT